MAITKFFNEMSADDGSVREHYAAYAKWLSDTPADRIARKRAEADSLFHRYGITFAVYGEESGTERLIPFDIIPRIIPASEWKGLEAGMRQRVKALNTFIHDIYHDQEILKAGHIPKEQVLNNAQYRPEMQGVDVPCNVYAHIAGVDVVRAGAGEFYVLEDNLRVPSGVAYMLENRAITKRVLPDLFEQAQIAPIHDYPARLFDMLVSLSPRDIEQPVVVVLTPGIFNSAYFEHAFLAQQMGAELVEGSDLVVQADDCVYMKTVSGLERVDVIYRRIDDLFLDPEAFIPDSILGVPGLMRAWKKGNVGLANAPGAGVADDKVVYAFVPKIIKYYLDQDPIVPNVETFLCVNPKEMEYVLANLEKLVVKPANESGGYGMIVGPHSTKKERTEFAERIKADPRNYIAQPTLALSTAPTLVGNNSLEPRHLDLRPFILQGASTYVTTGGLTRVAMKKGSLVVNSSQGGGSKDTWVVDTGA